MNNAKRVLLALLIVVLAIGGQAQNFRGGLRAGFTATQMSGDELSGFHKLGAYAGGFVNWRFVQNDHWAIQPEINFVMKGSSTFLRPDKNGNIGNKYVLTLYYIEVPALVKYRIIKGLEVEFGPTFGVLFAATEKDANGKMPGRMPFRRFELCGMAGVSYTFKEHYGISLRFVQTAIPVRVNDGYHSQQYLTKKQFSTEIAFSLFYQF
jgi:hypothetical protein